MKEEIVHIPHESNDSDGESMFKEYVREKAQELKVSEDYFLLEFL